MNNFTLPDLILKCSNSNKFSLYLFIISSIFFFIFNFIKLDLPILEQHPFRQTQTALTTFYLFQDGFTLNYITPVVGYPWSIPFEFPVYQSVVKFFVIFLNLPLTETGRFISLIFGYLCLIPTYLILKVLGLSKKKIFYILSFILSTPIFIFWSGTFMIESTALFFSLFFLFYSIKAFKSNIDFVSTFLIFTFLTLALLQKVTTALPILILVIIYYFLNFNLLKIKKNPQIILYLFIMFCLPFIIAYSWTMYADFIKELNQIGKSLTSKALSTWNFGTVEQRFSKDLWYHTIYNRILIDNSIHILGAIIILISLILNTNFYYKKLIFVCLLFFTLPFLLFTNLHIVHNYYQYANFIFFSIALAISIFSLTEYLNDKFIKIKFIKTSVYSFIFIILVINGFYLFVSGIYGQSSYKKSGIDSQTLKLTQFLKTETNSRDPIIVLGYDWSSKIAFYSQRKSLTVPAWLDEIKILKNYKKYLPPDTKTLSIINCYPSSNRKFDKIETVLNANFILIKIIDNCKIYKLK